VRAVLQKTSLNDFTVLLWFVP